MIIKYISIRRLLLLQKWNGFKQVMISYGMYWLFWCIKKDFCFCFSKDWFPLKFPSDQLVVNYIRTLVSSIFIHLSTPVNWRCYLKLCRDRQWNGCQSIVCVGALCVCMCPRHVDGLVQERRNSSALAMALRLVLNHRCVWRILFAADCLSLDHQLWKHYIDMLT